MIRYLKRHQLDEIKYDNCIKEAINTRIYAYTWYLDCVADNWGVLILNDYEAVFPLPWRQKYFIIYIYPPAWTQQLGVFYKKEIPPALISNFMNAIPKKFKKVTIQFNSQNDLSLFKSVEKKNFFLSLNKTYENLYKAFNTNRKRDLKKVNTSTLKVEKEISSEEFLNFYLNTKKGYKIELNQILALKKLLNSNKTSISIWGIRKNNQLIAGLIWLKDTNRITNLLPVSNDEAKKLGLQALIVTELIQQFSNSNLLLDFEGSMIPGVAKYYKSFGAKIEMYNFYKQIQF